MIIMIGGDKEIFDRVKPLLDHLGANILYTGGIGNGSVASWCTTLWVRQPGW